MYGQINFSLNIYLSVFLSHPNLTMVFLLVFPTTSLLLFLLLLCSNPITIYIEEPNISSSRSARSKSTNKGRRLTTHTPNGHAISPMSLNISPIDSTHTSHVQAYSNDPHIHSHFLFYTWGIAIQLHRNYLFTKEKRS